MMNNVVLIFRLSSDISHSRVERASSCKDDPGGSEARRSHLCRHVSAIAVAVPQLGVPRLQTHTRRAASVITIMCAPQHDTTITADLRRYRRRGTGKDRIGRGGGSQTGPDYKGAPGHPRIPRHTHHQPSPCLHTTLFNLVAHLQTCNRSRRRRHRRELAHEIAFCTPLWELV